MPKPPRKAAAADIQKEELFAYAFVRNGGNGAAAAREVYGPTNDNSAYVCASKMLRKAKVREIVEKANAIRREEHQRFLENTGERLVQVSAALQEMMQDKTMPPSERMKAIRMLGRMNGVELSEEAAIEKARAEGATQTRRVPGQEAPNNEDTFRQTIFMLSPPPIPPGGVVPPALAEQWKALGWKPGYEER